MLFRRPSSSTKPTRRRPRPTQQQRFLAQSRVSAAKSEKILAEEAAIYDAVADALDGARLELDQIALVQLL